MTDKKYDVYAIGNALVDIEFHVSEEKLVEMGIDKGVMTLVDEQRQNGLLAQLGNSHEKMACGGSAANTIIAVSQLGARTHFDCRVSGDMAGQFFSRDLLETGVHATLHVEDPPSGATGKCLVFVTPDADRTMNTFLGVSAELNVEDINTDAIRDSEIVYIEGYLVSADCTREAAIEARRFADARQIRTALTLSDPNMVTFFREGIEQMIGEGVDLLFANEEEALGLAQTDRFEDAVEMLKKIATRFAITRGKHGATLFDGTSIIDIDSYPVNAIDTLGAGDMFAGAFLYGLCKGMEFGRAGDLASLASSRIVTQYGPRLSAEQSQKLLKFFMSPD